MGKSTAKKEKEEEDEEEEEENNENEMAVVLVMVGCGMMCDFKNGRCFVRIVRLDLVLNYR